ncbi:MAG: LLM class flavin-dependent oxidoreductase [Rhodospirillaceae bacterium]|jgi:alkanesulfonate monooxygenase SsuD/methylene tetrahydromethanopterin reductase-like flavin-dependent oxidoreductase (luciferase family)|nr:LLM class flavin-dependent oxidoreductase [Rhodospirillaceae bacterium]
MKFGIQFFPDIGPDEKTAADYWAESLALTELCDDLGYHHVRTVEHYFHRYGGYSTNPVVFLAAASQRTRHAKLITGAILPVFNHPLKVAGEIGMLDAISGGRLEVGFARAFLPHEFRTHGVSLDESRDRFDEGVEQVRRLLEEEDVSSNGRFHSFSNVTSLPRPTQSPRPPFWIAATSADQSFAMAGKGGHGLMTFPRDPEGLRDRLKIYRDAWRAAGHPGNGQVMIAFHMYCAPTREEAHFVAGHRVDAYLKAQYDAASDWAEGTTSKDYPTHPKLTETLGKMRFANKLDDGSIWVGTPNEIKGMIRYYNDAVGGFDLASLQVNFHTLPVDQAEASMRLFSSDVMPAFVETR